MRIVHQHGPCSPLADAHGKPPAHDEILNADQNRVESIQRRVSATTGRGKLTKRAAPVQPGPKKSPGHSAPSSTPSLPATSGRSLSTGNYVVTVGLGTPASKYTVVFDTGSDTTWVQCRPCVVKCYKQKEPLFDPAKSSTYANVSCSDPACDDLDSNGCTGGHCLYAVQYGDGSYTVGFFAQDTLTIAHDAIKVTTTSLHMRQWPMRTSRDTDRTILTWRRAWKCCRGSGSGAGRRTAGCSGRRRG